jgi:hypothetical protein
MDHMPKETNLLLLFDGLFEEVSLKCAKLKIRSNESKESNLSSLAVKNS